MAIIFEDSSICPLCNKVLTKMEEYLLFPPFTGNKKEPLFIFNDGGVHVKCLNEHPLGKDALLYLEMYHNNRNAVHFGIGTNGQFIKERKNRLSWTLLTSDPNEDLFKFNFYIVDETRLSEWVEREEFIKVARRFNQEGKWEGLTEFNLLDFLIDFVKV